MWTTISLKCIIRLIQYIQQMLNHFIHVKGGLPAYLIKPIGRVCKYHLLLEVRRSAPSFCLTVLTIFQALVKASSATSYQHYEELKEGVEAAKRVADRSHEAKRRAENARTAKSLRTRVRDWKGHRFENFGEFLLDDILGVTKSNLTREYHVFLFEKVILCCKEVRRASPKEEKGNQRNSTLRNHPDPLVLPLPGGYPQTKNTPLLLKGRIFLRVVTQVVGASASNPSRSLPTVFLVNATDAQFSFCEFETAPTHCEVERR